MIRFIASVFLSLILLISVPSKIHNTSIISAGTKVPKKVEPTISELSMFLDSIAFLESQGTMDPRIENKFGMLGKYQFSPTTISFLGYGVSREEFLANEELQDSVMVAYLRSNYRELYPLYVQYKGKYVNGVKITLSGMLAGAHFAGAGGMTRFLTESIETTDYFGTDLSYYMNRFALFDLPVGELK